MQAWRNYIHDTIPLDRQQPHRGSMQRLAVAASPPKQNVQTALQLDLLCSEYWSKGRLSNEMRHV